MRKSALAGLLACAVIFGLNNQQAHALSFDELVIDSVDVTKNISSSNDPVVKLLSSDEQEEQENSKPKTKEPKKHKVAEGESLAKIAKQYKTSWKRLFYKNTNIDDPDVIAPGQVLIIPKPGEKLKERDLPEPPVQQPAEASATVASSSADTSAPQAPSPAPARIRRNSSAGNTYSYGYCTWYVKNRRPDIPNGLGNANTWYYRAQAMGLPTGTTPRAGAVGTSTRGSLGHVVYVESVNGNGTINISEMNHKGWGVISRRTVPASDFRYIY